MRALLQRTTGARVTVQDETVGEIQNGFVVLLGICEGDGEAEAAYLTKKICELRVFTDAQDKLNLSLLDVGGALLVVSQFTLYADCKKGRRPSFTGAARPAHANPLYARFCDMLRAQGVQRVEQGVFGAHMEVSLLNDGPVTIWLDTDELMKG